MNCKHNEKSKLSGGYRKDPPPLYSNNRNTLPQTMSMTL